MSIELPVAEWVAVIFILKQHDWNKKQSAWSDRKPKQFMDTSETQACVCNSGISS